MSTENTPTPASGSDFDRFPGTTPVLGETPRTRETPVGGTPPAAPGGTLGTARGEAKSVAHEGADAARHVAETATEEVKAVAHEASVQVKDLLGNAASTLKEQAGVQQQRAAQGLWSVSEELRSMSRNAEGNGTMAGLVGQAADRAGDLASWFEARDPGTLLEDVKSFARRRPGAFLAIAAGAGLLAGRLTRGLTASGGQPSSSPTRRAPAVRPAYPSTPPPVEPTLATPTGVLAGTLPEYEADVSGGDPWGGRPVGTDPLAAEPVVEPGLPPRSTDDERGTFPR